MKDSLPISRDANRVGVGVSLSTAGSCRTIWTTGRDLQERHTQIINIPSTFERHNSYSILLPDW